MTDPEWTEVAERALEVIDRYDDGHPAVDRAYAELGAALDALRGVLPDRGGRRPGMQMFNDCIPD